MWFSRMTLWPYELRAGGPGSRRLSWSAGAPRASALAAFGRVVDDDLEGAGQRGDAQVSGARRQFRSVPPGNRRRERQVDEAGPGHLERSRTSRPAPRPRPRSDVLGHLPGGAPSDAGQGEGAVDLEVGPRRRGAEPGLRPGLELLGERGPRDGVHGGEQAWHSPFCSRQAYQPAGRAPAATAAQGARGRQRPGLQGRGRLAASLAGRANSSLQDDRLTPALRFATSTWTGRQPVLFGVNWQVQRRRTLGRAGPERRGQDHAHAAGRRATSTPRGAASTSSASDWAAPTYAPCGNAGRHRVGQRRPHDRARG